MGFTLLEILVVMAIFLTLTVVVTDIFMMILKSQNQTSIREKTLSDLRFTMETIARQIRTAEIDYQNQLPANSRYIRDSDEGIADWESEIHLIDYNGKKISYYLDATGGGILKSETDGQIGQLSDPTYYTVTKLFFYIDPPTSPFSEERCNQGQGPNGCLAGVLCSLNDQSGKNGYCLCQNLSGAPDNSKCATSNCVGINGNYYCMPHNTQPRVTIVLGFESKGTKASERKTIYLQTTASSRVYKR